MKRRNVLKLIALMVVAGWHGLHAYAVPITLNLDPAGTTSNLNIYGTVLTNGSATWPAMGAYRDYQFQLHTISGSTSFDSFSVQLSASLRNGTSVGNTLRATLWAGPIVGNPNLSASLLTATTDNSSLTTSSFTSVMLTGSTFTPQLITPTPGIFFFRIWAEGAGSVSGFQTKMASTLGEFQAITMVDSPAIDGSIGFDTDNDGFIDGSETAQYDTIAEVPEPSSPAIVALGMGLAAVAAFRRLA